MQYHFTLPGEGITLFTRTMTVEAYKDAPLPDGFFRWSIPPTSTPTTRPSRASSQRGCSRRKRPPQRGAL